jgi:hypothetical protein
MEDGPAVSVARAGDWPVRPMVGIPQTWGSRPHPYTHLGRALLAPPQRSPARPGWAGEVGIRTKIGAIRTNVEILRTPVKRIRTGVKIVETNVGIARTSVKTLSRDVGPIRTGVEALRTLVKIILT